MPTVLDVAKLAGVAPITVSRVINRSGYFSEETRKRVEAAAAELGYIQNSVARSLRSSRTNTIALIVSDITNPFFTSLARGVEDTASDAGYNVFFCNTDELTEEEEKYTQVLLQKQVDGFLLVPAHSSPHSIQMIQKHNIPLVIIDRWVPAVEVDAVRCDSEGGSYQLIRLLLSLGHRNIAMISGPKDVSTSIDRVNGYHRALEEAGLPLNESYLQYGEYDQSSGYELTKRILAMDPRPTAIFGANNFIAIGILKALNDAGIKVPDDISIVGFDDLPEPLVVSPFLTVASQPSYEMGCRATRLLLERLANKEKSEQQQIILPTDIIVRGSTAKAPL
jgi:LacI family transcriptional regulator